MKPSEITESHVDEMFLMYGQNKTQPEIAKHFGLTKSAVQRYMAERKKRIADDNDNNIFSIEAYMKPTDTAKLSGQEMGEIFVDVANGVPIRDIAAKLNLSYDQLRKRIFVAKRNGFNVKDKPGTHEIKMLNRQKTLLSRRLLAETIKTATTREVLSKRPDLIERFLPFLDETDSFWIKSDIMSINCWIDKLDDIGKPHVSRFHAVSRG